MVKIYGNDPYLNNLICVCGIGLYPLLLMLSYSGIEIIKGGLIGNPQVFGIGVEWFTGLPVALTPAIVCMVHFFETINYFFDFGIEEEQE